MNRCVTSTKKNCPVRLKFISFIDISHATVRKLLKFMKYESGQYRYYINKIYECKVEGKITSGNT